MIGLTKMAARWAAMLAVAAAAFLFPGHRSGAGEASSCGDRYPNCGLAAVFSDGFEFYHPGEPDPVSIPPTRCGCAVKLLCAGESSFNWRLRLLRESGQSIRVQTYIFTADEMGEKVAAILKKKRRQGVEVKLIIDAYTKFRPADRRMYADFELRGISVMGFEPLYLLGIVDNRVLNVEDVNYRFHEKYWVIDDRVALLGGTNIANEYARYGEDPMNKWRDQDVLLTGPVVADVTRAFEQNYRYFSERRQLRVPLNRPSLWAGLWWKISGAEPPPTVAGEAVAIDVKKYNDGDAAARFIRSRPREGEDYIYQAYLHLISTAAESIIIENAYFVPNRALINALTEAAARGVRVVVVTNSDKTNDVTGMAPLSRFSYLPLMEAGVEIYEWRGDHPGFGSLHSKAAVFDGRVSVIGSFNLDPRGIYLNSENVALIDSGPVARDLAAYIEEVDIENSDRITMEQAKRWRSPSNLKDRFKLVFGVALEDWY